MWGPRTCAAPLATATDAAARARVSVGTWVGAAGVGVSCLTRLRASSIAMRAAAAGSLASFCTAILASPIVIYAVLK